MTKLPVSRAAQNMAWQFDAAPRDATESGMLIAALMRQVIEFMKPSVWRSGR